MLGSYDVHLSKMESSEQIQVNIGQLTTSKLNVHVKVNNQIFIKSHHKKLSAPVVLVGYPFAGAVARRAPQAASP